MRKENGVLFDVIDSNLVTLKHNPENFWRSVKTIGSEAFSKSYSLKSITIPANVDIGDAAFLSCANLKEVDILGYGSDTRIGLSAFSWCQKLKRINLPNGITKISGSLFSSCKELTEIEIPESVTCIEGYAFTGCKKLKKITIPENVTSIGSNAFDRCESLTSVTIPSSVTCIEMHAFYKCHNLKDITLPYDVFLKAYAFASCEKLKSLSLYSIDSEGRPLVDTFTDPEFIQDLVNNGSLCYLLDKGKELDKKDIIVEYYDYWKKNKESVRSGIDPKTGRKIVVDEEFISNIKTKGEE